MLDETPQVNGNGVPDDLGLFDVDFDIGFGSNGGTVRGFGDIDNDGLTDALFANSDGSIFYREGDTVSARVGSTRYDWSISYSGNILWSDADNSVVSSISGTGTGLDVVLMGLGSETVVLGDFNNDGFWNCDDINALSTAIAGGSTDLGFDMNSDGSITAADITDPVVGWLAVGGANNPAQTNGNPFLNGDANLSGGVDGSDFGIWNTSKFSSTSAWCSGDFNASGAVDGSDFGVWNANKFSSSDGVSTVPEPAWSVLLAVTTAGISAARRRLANGRRS